MKRIRKVIYTVTCTTNPSHVFQKAFEVEQGAEDLMIQQVEAYCPYCDKMVMVTRRRNLVMDDISVSVSLANRGILRR